MPELNSSLRFKVKNPFLYSAVDEKYVARLRTLSNTRFSLQKKNGLDEKVRQFYPLELL